MGKKNILPQRSVEKRDSGAQGNQRVHPYLSESGVPLTIALDVGLLSMSVLFSKEKPLELLL